MSGGLSSEQPPAGWYEDPERPGGVHQRRWDGTAWTDEYRETPRRSPWTPGVLIGGGVLAATAVASALIAADRTVLNTSEAIGYGVGAFTFPLLLAFAVRFAYVKLFARERAVWTDGVMIAAVILGLLALLGAAGREAEAREEPSGTAAMPVSGEAPATKLKIVR